MSRRSRNPATTPAYRKGVRISVTVAPRVSEDIDRLLAVGLFGRTRAEVTQRLVYRSLQDPDVRFFAQEPRR